MQAIETKYLGPTNSRGSRIKATCAAKSITVSYDDALNGEQNHIAAAGALRAALDWTEKHHGTLKSGQLANGNYVHVRGV